MGSDRQKYVIERIVAEDAQEALRLRLRRMTSATICRRMLSLKHPTLAAEIIDQKAEGVASAVRSALGYWEGSAAALNAKILSLYYFALQISIAEEVANADPDSTLESIQKHTEQGHGLATVRSLESTFPNHYYISALQSGHFGAYCKSTGIDLTGIAFDSRPRSWSKMKEEDKRRLVTLTDLLRRIPELRNLLCECLEQPPLSFHIVHSTKNMERQASSHAAAFNPTFRRDPATHQPSGVTSDATTYLTFATGFGGEGITPDYLSGLGLPITNIVSETDVVTKRPEIIGEYAHPAAENWYQSLPLYHSNVGTSLIVPIWGRVRDIVVVHFMTLYALSIVVRYLPSIWFEIENGSLDHIRALLEHYVTVADVVLPKCGVERIAGIGVSLVYPGSIHSPI
jgi:hypothetical protein